MLIWAAAVLLWALSPAVIHAQAVAPHVVPLGGGDTDVCAMCHRPHTSSSDTTWTDLFSGAGRNAFLVGSPSPLGDAGLCFACHNGGGLGSQIDVETSFSLASTHTLKPTNSPYGPLEKQCSTCHDSHGTDRQPDRSTYPALLRARWVYGPSLGIGVLQGEEVCATCHEARAAERWDGLDVFRDTAHGSAMATPSTGTLIRCSNCHDPHGSDSPPLIVDEVVPPAALATATVDGNDRSLCFGCHTASQDTYVGKSGYDDSGHAVASATVPITGSWPAAGAVRLVGECQVCHAPMGRSDGAGGAIPEMLEVAGRALCIGCHGPDGPASADVSSTAYPSANGADLEIMVSVVPSTPTVYDRHLQTYSREETGAQPRTMVGPREYRPSVDMGDISVGDVDGDGDNDLVVADPGAARLDLMVYDGLRGLDDETGSGSLAIAAAADLVEVADVILDGSGRPEIAVVNVAAGQLRLYRYSGGSLSLVAGPTTVGNGASSIASGDVTGTAAPDLVVTAYDDDQFRVFTESAGSLSASGPFATRNGPRGASIGDAWLGGSKDEIVVVNALETTGRVSVFTAIGPALGHVNGTPAATALAYDSEVADVLPGTTPAGTSGLEVSVVYREVSATTSSVVDVFPQLAAGGLGTPLAYETGPGYNSGELASGDVDGDGRAELLVGNAGWWGDPNGAQEPSVQVMRANGAGTALSTGETLWSGGSDLAGAEPPGLAVADLGAVGRTRHVVGGVSGAHVSTESISAPRHVECPDCHNPHEATSTVAAAPDAYGRILGTWGVAVTNMAVDTVLYTEKQGIEYEYELCFKCHSGWATLDGADNLAFEFNTLNPGEHAVEATPTNAAANSGSYVSGWGNDSILYCIDCHGMSVSTETTGPHASDAAPVLKQPYLGTRSTESDLICYACHKYAVYLTGASDSGGSASLFRDQDLGARTKLHEFHSETLLYGCSACHVGHGNPNEPHLIRDDVSYTHGGSGGSCTNDCHSGAAKTYTRP